MEQIPLETPSRARARAFRLQGRLFALLLLAFGGAGGALECWTLYDERRFSSIDVIVSVFALVFGAAALIEPRLVWAAGPARYSAPRVWRIASVATAAAATLAGLALAVWLAG